MAFSTLISKSVELLDQYAPKALQYYNQASRLDIAVITAATTVVLYNLRSMINNSKYKNLNLPPKVSYSLPLFGHTLYMATFPNKFLDWCISKYGDTFDLELLGNTVTVAGGPIAEQVMKEDSSKLSLEHGVLRETLHVHYLFNEKTFDIGFTANPSIIKTLLPQNKVMQVTDKIVDSLNYGLTQILDDGPQNIPHPCDFLQQLVAFISVRVLIGPEVATNRHVIDTFAQLTSDITRNVVLWQVLPEFWHKPLLPYLQSLNRHKVNMDKYVEPIVQKRRDMLRDGELEAHTQLDYMQELIEFQYPDGSTFTNKEITDAILLIAFASVHTTSMNAGFAIFWLLGRPDVMKAVVEEIDTVTAKYDGKITDESVKEMVFLDRFMRQVLRLGVDKLATGKKSMEEYTFKNGYQIPKGRMVQSLSRRLMYDAYTVESPTSDMDPFTFTKRESTHSGRDNIAFGLGKHLCPGRFFAVHEIKIVLITLLSKYKLSLKENKPVEPVVYAMGIFAIPNDSPILLTPRK